MVVPILVAWHALLGLLLSKDTHSPIKDKAMSIKTEAGFRDCSFGPFAHCGSLDFVKPATYPACQVGV